MSWMVCPLCKGSGNQELIKSGYTICTVCTGAKIISELTGRPPIPILDNKHPASHYGPAHPSTIDTDERRYS
jgi:hypothetical protein